MAIPTKTIVEQIYQGETIKCAKIESAISSFYKFPGIVNAEGDYEFQAVIRSEETSRIGIQVGDAAVRYIDTYPSFSRYVLPFKQITINDSDSLYIYLPPGVYYFYNLQLERGNVATQWQPAPEDAAEYSDEAAKNAVEDQTQTDIFNKLTNNGQSQGIYLLDGELYINASYIVFGTLIGDLIKGGVISGTEINIGNGVFVVNDQGEVTAANINITGGTIKIDTEGAAAQNSIILRHTWAGVEKSVMISGDHIIYKNGDSRIQILGDQISITNGSGSNIKQTAILNNVSGLGGFKLYQNGVSMFEAYGSGRAVIFDSNGKRRSLWDSTGIKFYDANGTTITKQL